MCICLFLFTGYKMYNTYVLFGRMPIFLYILRLFDCRFPFFFFFTCILRFKYICLLICFICVCLISFCMYIRLICIRTFLFIQFHNMCFVCIDTFFFLVFLVYAFYLFLCYVRISNDILLVY